MAIVPPEGPPQKLAREFRDALTRAVERAVGRSRPVAVALSGGIDSSAIAAAAVDVVGADNVHTFTYEFDDPSHSKETEYAREVAEALGIRRHEVFQISFEDYINAIPETVWHSESIADWPKAFMIANNTGSLLR